MCVAGLIRFFSLHERGVYNGIWIAITQSGPFVSPMITGAIIQTGGWRWSLWTMAIFAGTFLLLMFLFLPETLWVSPPREISG